MPFGATAGRALARSSGHSVFLDCTPEQSRTHARSQGEASMGHMRATHRTVRRALRGSVEASVRRTVAAAELLSQPAIPGTRRGAAGRLPPAVPLRTDVPAPLRGFAGRLPRRIAPGKRCGRQSNNSRVRAVLRRASDGMAARARLEGVVRCSPERRLLA
jgi:hypothetical protein